MYCPPWAGNLSVGQLKMLIAHFHDCPQGAHHHLSCLPKQDACLAMWAEGKAALGSPEATSSPGMQAVSPSSRGPPTRPQQALPSTYHTPLSSRPASPGSGAGFGKGPRGHWSPTPHPGCPQEDLGAEQREEGEGGPRSQLSPGGCPKRWHRPQCPSPDGDTAGTPTPSTKGLLFPLRPMEKSPPTSSWQLLLTPRTHKHLEAGAEAGFRGPSL